MLQAHSTIKECASIEHVAEFIDPDWGGKVNSNIGLSFRPAGAGGPARQPYAEVDFIPLSWIYEFGYWPHLTVVALPSVKPFSEAD